MEYTINLDPIIESRVQEWLGKSFDTETIKEVQSLVDNNQEAELVDAFYKELEFGTGGLRGIMGVGTNRMNRYTIGKATQGFANYLWKQQDQAVVKVAVAYDSRNHSQEFAQLVADVFSANHIQVYLFSALRPTPMLSFAIRHYGCQAGVMLTASHNPKEYNGYKAYWSDGCQLIAPHDRNVIEEVNQIRSFDQVKFERVGELIIPVGEELDQAYIAANGVLSLHPEAVQRQHDLKIVYSAIHGTGITIVPELLKAWGFSNVAVVEQQANPNGDFPTVIYPNPEEEDAMALAKAEGEAWGADLVMATDPDADRVGVAVKNIDGAYQLLNGNQIGSLLMHYVLHSKKEKDTLSVKDYVVKTIVTTDLESAIAKSFGVKCYETLTGFKYIGELITRLEGKEQYLVGGEESYGYLVGDLVRDKDAPNSCAFIAEMAAYYKDQGKTLFEVLMELYQTHGCYEEKLISLTKKGKSGAEEIQGMMQDLRSNPPKSLGGVIVSRVKDYKLSIDSDVLSGTTSSIDLPKSDVLQFITVDGDVISARPSGTEPKIKFYCSVKQPMHAIADYKELRESLVQRVDRMMKDLIG